jgi:hypothetical protein
LNRSIHIVSFDIPFPANYGGVIDVFYKIKALHENGVKIKLHCFEYGDRGVAPELEKYCTHVFYYPRKKITLDITKPYIVATRGNATLLKNLLKDNDPILFEALHCCLLLDHPQLKNRFKMVRMHNIEHDYYRLLAESESNFCLKTYYGIESILLKNFESILRHANLILAISKKDEACLKSRFGDAVKLLPAFHGNSSIISKLGSGDYCFYHGKLSVAENHVAAMFLVNEVFSSTNIPLIIAGNGIGSDLKNAALPHTNIRLIEDISPEEINTFIENAHINVLPTFQPTGIKLKLINVLFQGRFMLVNSHMVSHTGLEAACYIEDQPQEMVQRLEELMRQEFTREDLEKRQVIIEGIFDVHKNAQALIDLIP